MPNKLPSLKASVRTEFGKGSARRARREGQVPGVIYGHKTDPRHVLLDTLAFAAILRKEGTNAVLSLDIEGEEQLALTKQIDVNPLTREIEHTDLLVVKKGEKVIVEVTVNLVGEAAPGTLVTQDATVVEVEADALNIPEYLEVSIEDAEAGLMVTAADLDLPSGVTMISDPEWLIVNVIEAPTEDEMAGDEDDEVAGAIEESQEQDKAESEAAAEDE
ncbi:50S ribosomal protein L25/general stress protein Ctc [Dietzia sp. 179-F 9C3 NHS]|uniref:50S ribosomal protein L25/general stress protein Ctc n=1 Tax=Dietzia sp. 179-F 9C3 NHS TaxID=3374295 RepID=UPI00387A55E4